MLVMTRSVLAEPGPVEARKATSNHGSIDGMNATNVSKKVGAALDRLRHIKVDSKTKDSGEKALDVTNGIPPLTPLSESGDADCPSVGSSSFNPFPTPPPSTSSITGGTTASGSLNPYYQPCHAPNSNNSNSSTLVDLPPDCRLLHPPSNQPPPLITAEDAQNRTLSMENTSKLRHVGPTMSEPPQLIPLENLNPPYAVDRSLHHVGEQQQQIPIFSFAAQEGKANLITLVQPSATDMAIAAHGHWLPIPQQHLAAVGENSRQFIHLQPGWDGLAVADGGEGSLVHGDGSYLMEAPMLAPPRKSVKRVACSCPNCMMGLNARAVNPDGTLKKKKHNCHFPMCNKVYGKTSHLRAHIRMHTGERPFLCRWPYCNKKFTRSDELQRHHRTHTGEKKYQCKTCNKRFMRSDHLNKHVKIHQRPPNPNEEETEEPAKDQETPSSPTSVSSGSDTACGDLGDIDLDTNMNTDAAAVCSSQQSESQGSDVKKSEKLPEPDASLFYSPSPPVASGQGKLSHLNLPAVSCNHVMIPMDVHIQPSPIAGCSSMHEDDVQAAMDRMHLESTYSPHGHPALLQMPLPQSNEYLLSSSCMQALPTPEPQLVYQAPPQVLRHLSSTFAMTDPISSMTAISSANHCP